MLNPGCLGMPSLQISFVSLLLVHQNPQARSRTRTLRNGFRPSFMWGLVPVPTELIWFCGFLDCSSVISGPGIGSGLTASSYGSWIRKNSCQPEDAHIHSNRGWCSKHHNGTDTERRVMLTSHRQSCHKLLLNLKVRNGYNLSWAHPRRLLES